MRNQSVVVLLVCFLILPARSVFSAGAETGHPSLAAHRQALIDAEGALRRLHVKGTVGLCVSYLVAVVITPFVQPYVGVSTGWLWMHITLAALLGNHWRMTKVERMVRHVRRTATEYVRDFIVHLKKAGQHWREGTLTDAEIRSLQEHYEIIDGKIIDWEDPNAVEEAFGSETADAWLWLKTDGVEEGAIHMQRQIEAKDAANR